MPFELPDLPYTLDALAPHVSRETLQYHHGKHHQAYVNNLNNLTRDTPLASKSLEDLIREAEGPVFNNAAQVWNHSFYWNCLSPRGGGAPTGALAEAFATCFGSFDTFKEAFTKAALGHFGSGWVWLARDAQGHCSIIATANAGNPLRDGLKPMLVCDVWEHAYYIDYRNDRARYVAAFWNLVNWDYVNLNRCNS